LKFESRYENIMRTTIKADMIKKRNEQRKIEPCTIKQKELICAIESALELDKSKYFAGTSKEDASMWLAKYAGIYRQMQKRKAC
jgi:hypothetical protein